MPRILQIDDDVIREVAKVKEYSLKYPCGEAYRELLKVGDALPVGDNPEHVVHIHDGYRAVYSVSVMDTKKYHHLSLSVEGKGKYPGIPDTEIILDLFGMGKDVHDLDSLWIEEKAKAVNLIKEIEE
jgi:hypothetical protein